ncbi:MAG: hypothetical protein ABIQ07_03025 [Ginsengibacter sp.]
MHNFTPEDLVQYLYKETSQEKSTAIMAALETDWSLREMYNVIVSAQKRLEAFELSPREEAVNSILHYAQKATAELHPH